MKFLALLTLLCISELGWSKKYLRVCYYTNWSQYRPSPGKFFPEDIDATLCTHIIYAFGKLVNNRMVNFEWNDDQLYGRVMALKQQNPELQVYLAMGGWNAGSEDYSRMSATAADRQTFIESSITWLRQYNFDGLDMDWEYPARRGGAPEDKENFVILLKELRDAYDAEAAANGRTPLALTAAVAAGSGNINDTYNVPEISKYLDFIAIMTYDFHGGSWEDQTGHNSPLYPTPTQKDQTFCMAWAAQYWVDLGAPREKLLIGLPTYGRTFNLLDANNNGIGAPSKGGGPAGTYTRESGFLSYYEICEKQQSGAGQTFRDPISRVPYYTEGNLWIGFDDKLSLYEKIKELVIPGGFGGIMIWSLPLDDFFGKCFPERYPLIKYMNQLLEADENGQPLPDPPSDELPPAPPAPTSNPDNGSGGGDGGGSGGDGGTGGEGFCADKGNGLFPDPESCSNYYNCWGGTGLVQSCNDGLYFNPSFNGCDFPENVDCSAK